MGQRLWKEANRGRVCGSSQSESGHQFLGVFRGGIHIQPWSAGARLQPAGQPPNISTPTPRSFGRCKYTCGGWIRGLQCGVVPRPTLKPLGRSNGLILVPHAHASANKGWIGMYRRLCKTSEPLGTGVHRDSPSPCGRNLKRFENGRRFQTPHRRAKHAQYCCSTCCTHKIAL